MTKEYLEREAEKWLRKYLLCCNCENKVNCISNFSYCKNVVLQSYLASAEPREKRIAELEAENEQIKNSDTLCTLIGEQKIKIAELEKENAELKSRDCWKGCLYASGKSVLIYEFLQQRYNLTNAKEIIKKCLRLWNDVMTEETVKALISEAEQFLKDLEK